MKILWVDPFFLHPTDRGGQIRTLGTLKELHKNHEIHFAALNNPLNTEGPSRSVEYSTKHIVVEHIIPRRGSLQMLPQLVANLVDESPLAVSRFRSANLRETLRRLIAVERFDSIVCDFLATAPNLPDIGQCVLFQHNVETTIWQRHAEQARDAARRQFFAWQARKMKSYERRVCRASKYVIAVSELDAQRMQTMYGIDKVKAVPTGVDIDYFRAQSGSGPQVLPRIASDIVFSGSMDWMPNVDAMEFFLSKVLPLIRAKRPETTISIAGRLPDPRVYKAAEGLPGITITGRVDDMRPYMWGAKVSIVPIRIGGGTRLKIYECMAAGLPIVSTTIGAEGLDYTPGKDMLIADSPEDFAAACLRLLDDAGLHQAMAGDALRLVESRFSWAAVTKDFESILEANRL